jgi:predicted O-methyltransferase YrrM
MRDGIIRDSGGMPIPWYTYAATDYLVKMIRNDMSVFEYGSGSSTLWWALRVERVVSVEHDPKWYRLIGKQLPSNVEYHHIPLVRGGEYCRKIGEYKNEFDVIVIDGRDRNNCIANGIDALRDGGMIVFDNSERKRYAPALNLLHTRRFSETHFFGPGPVCEYEWRTSIYSKKENNMRIAV